MYNREDDSENIRRELNSLRNLQEKTANTRRILNEANEIQQSDKAIAITDDIKFGSNVLQNQIDEFRSAVDSGAEFATPNPNNVAECPLIYMPKTNNIIFSGTIPALNNLSFQFVLKSSTGIGCFIWAKGLIMSDENIKILVKLQGFYKNWKEEWQSSARELESLRNLQ